MVKLNQEIHTKTTGICDMCHLEKKELITFSLDSVELPPLTPIDPVYVSTVHLEIVFCKDCLVDALARFNTVKEKNTVRATIKSSTPPVTLKKSLNPKSISKKKK